MSILPRIDLSLTPAKTQVDVGAAGVDIHADAGSEINVTVSSTLGGVALHVGLDRLLNSTSPVDHLLNGPDALARFRSGAVPSDPSPIATRGMTVRAGDPYSEVATRYAIGGVSVTAPGIRAELTLRAGEAGLAIRAETGVDTRGVTNVRDPAAAAELRVRIDAPGGATATARGIDVGAMATSVGAASSGTSAGASVADLPAVSFAGLVNVLGGSIATPADAPVGAVLTYLARDGATIVELRTAGGFAGATSTSELPLTGAFTARADANFTLTGVYVRPGGVLPPSQFIVAEVTGTATAAPATAHEAGPKDAAGVPPQPPAGLGEDGAGSAPRPDGSTIPAGNPAPPSDDQKSFGEASHDAPDSGRPYLHAIWYDILALRFAALGVDLAHRTAVLRDAVWATAMEHGPFANATASDVLSQVSRTIDLAGASDAAIIAALFAERSRQDNGGNLVHYPNVLPFNQAQVIERLIDEAANASTRAAAA